MSFAVVRSRILRPTKSIPKFLAITSRPTSTDGAPFNIHGIVEVHRGKDARSKHLVRAQVLDYGGNVFVDVRRFGLPKDAPEDSVDFLPSKKGICLSVEQFEELLKAVPEIKKLVEKASEANQSDQ